MPPDSRCYKDFKMLPGVVQFTGTVELLTCGTVKVTFLFGHV